MSTVSDNRPPLSETPAPGARPRELQREREREGRSVGFAPRRRRWPGLLVLAIVAAGLGGLAVSSLYDQRSPGERLDATVQNLRDGAQAAAADGARATDRAAAALGDAGITAAVKTALAADPKLSAVKIEVRTDDGVVTLDGPAPDAVSRERAATLAAAPAGVNRVDNHLVVSTAGSDASR